MKYFVSIAAAIALVSGCSSVSVHRDYDPSVEFAALETYAWQHESQPKTGDPRVDNDLLDDRIRQAVDAVLAARGLENSEAADADILVAYYMTYKRRISGNTWVFGIGRGYYDGYGGVGYNTAISDYDEGCLTIDIISRFSGKAIWRGVGCRSTYEASTPEKVTAIVDSAVDRILEDFPPGQ